MIKNIIFDFGDVFINLDKASIPAAFHRLGVDPNLPQFRSLNNAYEIGALSNDQFLEQAAGLLGLYNFEVIARIWNSMIADFPEYRLEFLESLSSQQDFRLFLLSNTNALHIEHVKRKMGEANYGRFMACFEGVHLSHEIGLRKPDAEVFEFLLKKHELYPNETLFIDDTKENIMGASALGIQTWHIQVGEQDVIALPNYLEQ